MIAPACVRRIPRMILPPVVIGMTGAQANRPGMRSNHVSVPMRSRLESSRGGWEVQNALRPKRTTWSVEDCIPTGTVGNEKKSRSWDSPNEKRLPVGTPAGVSLWVADGIRTRDIQIHNLAP
jgi:hypothetical protein